MNFKAIFNTISLILKYISFLMLVPCLCAVLLKEYESIFPFSAVAVLSYVLYKILKNGEAGNEFNNINRSEALASVLFAWILISLISAIPFLYYGLNPIDALFEAVSGITTTGATILSDFSQYENYKTMFFWRSFSQWLGGMGILVLFIAVLPSFAIAGRQMFFAESPGASSTESRLTPRIRQTAGALWGIYSVLTIIEIGILIYMGMPVFDAVCNSLSCLSGGGFSPAADSIMHYAKPKFFWSIAVFMFLSGMNFSLQYKIYVKRNIKAILKDDEFKLYCSVVLLFTIMIALILASHHTYSIKQSIESAFFHVVSIITTTGFVIEDYNNWDIRAKLLIFILMFTGASIGSASGGVKLLRIVFIIKYLKRQISKIYHPNGVYPIKINKTVVSEDNVRQMISFVIFYYTIFVITAGLMVYIEQNAIVGVSSAIASLGNVGPAFGIAGPMGNFSTMHTGTKIIFIFNMLIGRLELIPFLALLHPDFWSMKKNKVSSKQ